ncbi:MAG TPA: alpha/beta hydrolase [Acidimicrobiales bacterium]|jgi:acetyl esterase/lipase|nr:alpha/beta hydrolase [Acidimicrobiales bacterium]
MTDRQSAHPAVAAELQSALAALAGDMATASLTADLIPRMRLSVDAERRSFEDLRLLGPVVLEEIETPGPPNGPSVSILLCRPEQRVGLAPCVIYFHPGGMVCGDNRTDIASYFDWVSDLGVVIASIEYRLAPEHPDPAPIDDSYAGLLWLVEHGAELGIDSARIVLLGVSAGGCLAAGVSLRARDTGGPTVAGQLLIGPMLDDRCETVSSQELVGEGTWDSISNMTGWTALLGERRGTATVSSFSAPSRAATLGGLPPTYIDVGSVETFRDEVLEFATRIWQDGGDAELHVWEGGFHGFDEVAPHAAISQSARAARRDWLSRLLR